MGPKHQYLPESNIIELEALLQAISNGPFAGSRALSESGGATKWPGRRSITDSDDAHFLSAANLALTRHTRRHLDLDREVGVCSQRQAADAKSGYVLGDLSVLEGLGVGASGRRVNGGRQRARTVLVNLGSTCQGRLRARIKRYKPHVPVDTRRKPFPGHHLWGDREWHPGQSCRRPFSRRDMCFFDHRCRQRQGQGD